MGKTLDRIFNQIFKKRINNGENFYQVVTETFIEAKKLKGQKGINEMFIKIIRADTYKLETVKYMIELGANPNYNNDLPFLLSCANPTPDVPLYLIEQYNANVNTMYKNGNAIYYAAQHIETIRVLYDHGYFSSNNDIDEYLDHPKVIKILLEKEYDINLILKSFSKRNIFRSNPELNEIFMDQIKKQKNFIQLDSNCLTNILNLFLNVKNSLSLEDVRIIVELGANPRYQSDNFLPLSCRYTKNPAIPVYFITECGCDINTCNSQALYVSIAGDHFDTTKILLELGIIITDNCITLATHNKKYLDLIISFETDFNRLEKILMKNLLKNNTKLNIARTLIENGVDMNQAILTFHN